MVRMPLLLSVGLIGFSVVSAGCQSPYHSDRGAVLGGLLGAGTGAIIGGATGQPGAGAAIRTGGRGGRASAGFARPAVSG